jgi:uncharacterized membrane protein (Fun14 family)
MVYRSGTDVEKKRPALLHAIRTMPRWKWHLLTIGLVLGSIGLVSQVSAFLNTPHDPVFPHHAQVAPAPSDSAANPSSGNPGASPQPAATSPDAGTDPAPETTSPWKPFMTKFGFSLFVGISVGTIFRTFIRTAMVVTGLIVATAAALSYYHVVNVDMTAVNHETALATGWLADQGYRVKDMLFHTLPSSTAAGIGFFLGLKRR